MHPKNRVFSALTMLFVLSACTDPEPAVTLDEPDEPITQTTPDEPDEPEPIDWNACTLQGLGGQTYPADCATVEVPLDWSEPDGETIDLFVRRVGAPQPEGRSVWLLSGGPGFAGLELEPIAPWLHTQDPGTTVYIPDHRGTGASTRLTCPEQEVAGTPGEALITDEEWPACVEWLEANWGERMQHFSTTQAARDLRGLIERTRAEDEQTFVYGISYGTYIAYRYLQVAPDQADGVIMDSLAPPGHTFISEQDVLTNEAARVHFFGACADDETCSAKLGEDPWQVVEGLMEKIDQGHCQPLHDVGVTKANLRQALAQVINNMQIRALAPAIVYRYDRCSEDDVAALTQAFSGQAGTPPLTVSAYSPVLGANIALSEMWEASEPTLEEVVERDATQPISRGVSVSMAKLVGMWPRYGDDGLIGRAADTDTPVLMMAGVLDILTPLELQRTATLTLDGPNQIFVEFPYAIHSVIGSTPLPGQSGLATCAMGLWTQFMKAPTEALDTACVSQTVAPDFTGPTQLAQQLFGRPDLWE